ncbi:MAG: hypothetical protein LUQ04_05435 [Methanoregula sp.]|nr:hypothetical protein [Methanoregula sp.]
MKKIIWGLHAEKFEGKIQPKSGDELYECEPCKIRCWKDGTIIITSSR